MSTILEYKCPCCGGAVNFDSNQQKMVCPYCDAEFDIEALKKSQQTQEEIQKPDQQEWEIKTDNQWSNEELDGLNVYICQSCGGELIADQSAGAMNCPYCDNPVILKSNFSGDLRPDYVIPFKLDKKAAKEAMANHLKGKPLLPKVFKDQNHIDEIKGVYVPFWLFDCDTFSQHKFKATKVRHWSDSKYDYTETSYFDVYRDGNLNFDHVPVDGSEKMPDDLMESVEPFDYSQMVDFDTAYLAGYVADKYDVDQKSSIGRANERIKKSTEEAFRNTVMGYATVNSVYSNISYSNSQSHYALLPVWILNTTWNDQKFIFAMNGQTGKFVGNLPTDKKLFWSWFLGVFAVSGIAAALLLLIITMLG
ncbi:hypothetical protein [Porcipelethomonas sp.]|uniref:hypothetical protein n=1 Tax=Porcipelethomonas sp. TaxID=2981675 RepID=UPI003EF21CB8